METHNENDIDPLAENPDLSSIGDGLERALTEERAPRPTTPEPLSPSVSEETEEPDRPRRNTMAATAEQRGAISLGTSPILHPEQMRQIIAFLSGGSEGRIQEGGKAKKLGQGAK